MAQHITRKLDHEKGKLRDKAQNPDFVESILEQGDNFDRGGIHATQMHPAGLCSRSTTYVSARGHPACACVTWIPHIIN